MRKNSSRATSLLVILFGLLQCALTNSLNVTSFGKLFVTNISPGTYQAGNQNWNICEGENGLIYVANGPLLEGGSNYWQRHYLPGEVYLKSVHKMDHNRILVGGNQEIGYFSRAEQPGESNYTSLMDRLDEQYHDFGSVWQILEQDGDYYLRAGKGVFTYDGDTIVPRIFGDIVDYIIFFEHRLLALISGEGLGMLGEDGFRLLPYGAFFADKRIMDITPSDQTGEFLIFTDDEGVYRADMQNYSLHEHFNVPEIIESQISAVILLDNQYHAIGTVRNGLYVLDDSGEIIQHLNRKNGLQNNTIITMFEDENHNVWLGLDYGISYVHLNSCLSIINSESGIGTGYVSIYYKDHLYLGTNQGLYYTKWIPGRSRDKGDMQIYPVNNSSGQVWNLNVFNGVLFCNHHEGLFRIEGDQAILMSSLEGSWKIDSLYSLPGYYLQSTYRGFFLYRQVAGNKLELVRKADELGVSRIFSQDSRGNIWIVEKDNVIHRYFPDPVTLEFSSGKSYNREDGVVFEKARIVGDNKQVIFSTDRGLYTFNEATEKFESTAYYNQILNTGDQINEFFEDPYDRVWYVTEDEIGYFSLHFGQMEKVSSPLHLVFNAYTHNFGKINVIDQENVLFGVDRGFYHFNAGCSAPMNKEYKAYIIDMITHAPAIVPSSERNGRNHPEYIHKKNSFEFLLTSNMIESQEEVYFSFKLDGYDEDWSEWSTRNRKEYSNLFEGTYTFRVKSKDNSDRESKESSYTFQVKPPQYRTVAAYFLYLLLVALLSLLIRRRWIRKHEKEKQSIEEKKQKELEEKKKKYEEEQLKSRQRISDLKNERLHQDLKHKSKELSNSMINILHKNEIMLNLKREMQNLYLEKNLDKRNYNIKKLIRTIEQEISTKKDLALFDTNLSAVHEEFLRKLKEAYPQLNQNDHRLCTFIKMNKSTKEIATFLNMSIRGVETSRYRLRKKMNLGSDENLYDVISHIE